MKTIHSLSGGKTSSYMAVHYPADYNIFALVTVDDLKCKPSDDKIVQMVSDKIGKEFIGTVEDDLTLKVIFDLEQKIGNEIIWVVGESFDELIRKKSNWLPSSLSRYCTTEMKVRPIWDWWYKNIGEKVKMGIGYRYDEMERADRFKSSFKGIVGKVGTRNKWQEIDWREGWFPLIENKVIHPTIVGWASTSGINFPIDSNCLGCFHKSPQQIAKNYQNHKNKIEWFIDKEKTARGTWKKDKKYSDIKDMPIQTDFLFGGGAGCSAGFCTD